jgi:hypothetical protein
LAQENFLTFLGACACFLDGFVDAPGEKKIPRPLGVSSADQKIFGGLNPLFCARRVVWRVVRGLVFFWVVVLGLGLGWGSKTAELSYKASAYRVHYTSTSPEVFFGMVALSARVRTGDWHESSLGYLRLKH